MPLYKVIKKEIKRSVHYTTAWDGWSAEVKVLNGEIEPFGEEEVIVKVEAEIPSNKE
jgi:hypothetical protein|tara:strand:- start:412 stop:582 length:171 start_codon:yes stop_codon:yes gene_type:complete